MEATTVRYTSEVAYAAYAAIRPLYENHREAYQAADAEITTNFMNYLAEEYGYDLTARQNEIIYGEAYQAGHSGGYSEIESYYQDYVNLVERVLNA